MTIDPHNPSTIYGSKDGAGPIKSSDAGNTWTSITNGLPQKVSVSALAIDPRHPSTLYLGAAGGIYKTDDGGGTWREIEDQSVGLSFAVDPTNSSVVYALLSIDDSAASGDGHGNPHRHIANANPPLAAVIKSVDGGATWSSVVGGIPSLPALYRLAIDPLSPSTLYLGTPNGVYRTTDAGQNWNRIASLPANAYSVIADPKTQGIIYVGGRMDDLPAMHLFIYKLNQDGSSLAYSTSIAGRGSEMGWGIVVDAAGSAYVSGQTGSADFPTVGAVQSRLAGYNAVVVKLDAGGKVVFSSFLGGSQTDEGGAIAVDGAGNIYIAGRTFSSDFPLVAGLQTSFPAGRGGTSPFITKISLASVAPKVTGAQKQGKNLLVYGSGFAHGAVIVANGNELNTTNDIDNPEGTLISKKGGKMVKAGQAATIQVMNPDGTMSNTISFTPTN